MNDVEAQRNGIMSSDDDDDNDEYNIYEGEQHTVWRGD